MEQKIMTTLANSHSLTEAVRIVIGLVNDSLSLASRRPLIATLEASAASFDRGSFTAGINQLQAFQNKVRAQIAPLDAVLADQLTQAAQQVMDAFSRSRGSHPKFQSRLRMAAEKRKLSFTGAAWQVHIVEASTNLTDWEMTGVAVDHGGGSFDFEDASAAIFPSRFYRIVSPPPSQRPSEQPTQAGSE